MSIKSHKIIRTLFIGLVSILLFYACAQTKYYTEEELGIRKETIYDETATTPARGVPIKKEAGESEKIARAFENSPPLISHDITGMLPIALTDNLCMDCHMPDEAVGSDATAIPESHFTDLDTGKYLGGDLDGNRYDCMQCHVIQTTLSPPVENIFKGEFRDEKGRYRSNLLNILNEGVEVE